MGQKQNPNTLRLGINKQSSSMWYAKGQRYINNVFDDVKLRDTVFKLYSGAGIHDILIQRYSDSAHVKILATRPGVVIGRKGADSSRLKVIVENILNVSTQVTVQEYKTPDQSAKILSESIASQLERRVQFRKAMKRAVQQAMRSGAKGIKVIISGRLNGAEIARSESYHEGRVPLHTFRADIDYHLATAKTTYGIIGVKVWVFRDEVIDTHSKNDEGV
ncbi:MAG: 30S ribosomal protein S3 [Pseudomonadota bacterium]|nr:30S ribosomal protein S3 [Pseudomonadota bacterium]